MENQPTYTKSTLVRMIFSQRHPEMDPDNMRPNGLGQSLFIEEKACLYKLIDAATRMAMKSYGQEWTNRSPSGKLSRKINSDHAHSVFDEFSGVLERARFSPVKRLKEFGYDKEVFDRARALLQD